MFLVLLLWSRMYIFMALGLTEWICKSSQQFCFIRKLQNHKCKRVSLIPENVASVLMRLPNMTAGKMLMFLQEDRMIHMFCRRFCQYVEKLDWRDNNLATQMSVGTRWENSWEWKKTRRIFVSHLLSRWEMQKGVFCSFLQVALTIGEIWGGGARGGT